MQTFQITLPETLIDKLDQVYNELQDLKKNFKPKEQTEYLSRNDVAEMLKIDISSVHNWTKKGILQSYQIGGRIFYKRKQVEASIVKLK